MRGTKTILLAALLCSCTGQRFWTVEHTTRENDSSKLTYSSSYLDLEFFRLAEVIDCFLIVKGSPIPATRPLHNSASLEKTGHFDEISNSSEPAYAGRPIGGERKSKDREMAVFNEEDQLCRGLANARETSLKIITDQGTLFTALLRHAGGQKFTFTKESKELLLQLLEQKQPFQLSLESYTMTIDSKGFEESYKKFSETPFLHNPFHLPF